MKHPSRQMNQVQWHGKLARWAWATQAEHAPGMAGRPAMQVGPVPRTVRGGPWSTVPTTGTYVRVQVSIRCLAVTLKPPLFCLIYGGRKR